MNIVYAILAFCVIIIVHEMGHFFVAKAFKMKVYEFSIGMGPTILKKHGKETDYSLKLLPIGGSVQLGEDEETEDPNSFRNKPVWQRMLVLAAGAIMNLILGVIICIIAVSISSTIVTTTIKGFHDGAQTNNVLQADDEILAINGLSIWSSMDISYALQNSVANADEDTSSVSYSFTIRRNNEVIELDNVSFLTAESDNGKSIVLDFYVYGGEKNIGSVLTTAVKTAASYGRLVWITLFDLLNGTYGINDLSGPVGVVSTMNKVASVSIESLLSMIALITINIGLFNLLPIPALDGGRIVFLIIEAIRRKPMKPEHEGMVHFIGFAALMLLMIIVTFNDIVRLVTGG